MVSSRCCSTKLSRSGRLRGSVRSALKHFVILSLPQPLSGRSERRAAEACPERSRRGRRRISSGSAWGRSETVVFVRKINDKPHLRFCTMPRIWRSFAVLRRTRSLRSLSGSGRLRMTNHRWERFVSQALSVCPMLLETKNKSVAPTVGAQAMFSSGAWLIEHPEASRADLVLAGVEGGLRAYTNAVSKDEKLRDGFLDQLVAAQAAGKLKETYVDAAVKPARRRIRRRRSDSGRHDESALSEGETPRSPSSLSVCPRRRRRGLHR